MGLVGGRFLCGAGLNGGRFLTGGFGCLWSGADFPGKREGVLEGNSFRRECGGTVSVRNGAVTCSGLSPRLRGNGMAVTAQQVINGLSPRLRGNLHQLPPGPRCLRSIPAPAGGTYSVLTFWDSGPGLSPRLRGNHCFCGGRGPEDGSIPRLRGNQRDGCAPTNVEGSIPAPAGEPLESSPPPPPHRVYPRACGGTRPVRILFNIVIGLSPRLRGNPRPPRGSSGANGSIPAPAGEPSTATKTKLSASVYPRACGEPHVG